MAYVLPQVEVFQDVSTQPTSALHPLPALIVGGNALPVRYGVLSEREQGRLGYYDDAVDTTYPWPNLPAGALVDLADGYTKLWVNNALLEYHDNAIDAGDVVTKVAGRANRVRAAATNFATNGAYARDASLFDRDVRPGDIVKVHYVPSGGSPTDLWTSVQALIGDAVSAVINAATSDATNSTTQGASASATFTAGPINCVTATANGAAYDGLEDGYISETYTVIVLEGSVNDDFTTARLRILSASGTDDVLSVTPAAASSPFAVGTRGLTLTFNHSHSGACSASATSESVNPNDLIAGQQWRVVVHQAFTAPVPTSGGTYSSANNVTYIIQVVKGGTYSSLPQIKVTTDTGVDLSGPTVVPGTGVSVPVGSLGVTVRFSGTALCTGDRYYIAVTGTGVGPLRTIVLNNNLPPTVHDGDRVGITLYILTPDLQAPMDREGSAPLVNWGESSTLVTVYSAMTVFDPTWTDGGVPLPLPVKSAAAAGYGVVFVEYRAWLPDLVGSVGAISDIGTIDTDIPGPLDPDNPLKYGVSKALANAGTTTNQAPVKFIAVSDPSDINAWTAALEPLVGKDDVYGIVPLTRMQSVLDAYHAHVTDESTPENGAWRSLWVSLPDVPAIPLVSAGSTVPGHLAATTSDGHPCLCVIEDDPLTAGTQYTQFRNPAGNGKFITNGVRAGDIVRAIYINDGFGNFTYSEFVVATVQSESQLLVAAGPPVGYSVAAKVEIWRNLAKIDEATAVGAIAGAYGDTRVCAVWPDTVEDGALSVPGYFLCAALAALAGAVLPHQGLTHVAVSGFTGMSRSIRFNRDQLNAMAGAGTWIVTQDPTSGTIFTRHAVTTAPNASVALREEMARRDRDSVSFRFKDEFAPFIGITNVVDSMREEILLATGNLIVVLKTELFTKELGGQLVDATVTRLSASLTDPDRFVMVLNCTFPYPLNNLDIHLVV
jgi:hypothetical protein